MNEQIIIEGPIEKLKPIYTILKGKDLFKDVVATVPSKCLKRITTHNALQVTMHIMGYSEDVQSLDRVNIELINYLISYEMSGLVNAEDDCMHKVINKINNILETNGYPAMDDQKTKTTIHKIKFMLLY